MTTPPLAAIDVKGLVKRFGDLTAVNGLDLRVEQGECFGLLGPNGAGKTTTCEILEGLQRADGGDVRLLGLRWEEQEAELRERLGVQLQESQLYEKLSVLPSRSAIERSWPEGLKTYFVFLLITSVSAVAEVALCSPVMIPSMHDALELVVTTDQRIDLALARLLVEVGGIAGQRMGRPFGTALLGIIALL